MEEDFRALLLGDASVLALCSGRVNFADHPQGQPLPAIVLTLIDDAEGHHLKGPDGLSTGRVQVDCYATTYGAAVQLSRAARAVLDGHHDATFPGVFHEGTQARREGGSNEAERPYRVTMDFLTNWSG